MKDPGVVVKETQGLFASGTKTSSEAAFGAWVLEEAGARMCRHLSTSGDTVKLLLAKWGNSLAIRLPVECTRAAGIKEGDIVEADVNASGEITLTPALRFDRKAFVKQARKRLASLPMTRPAVEEMRKQDRY